MIETVEMPEKAVPLGSVHLSEDDLYQLEQDLHAISRNPDIEFNFQSGEFTVSESSIDDIVSSDLVGDESIGFDIRLSSDEGDIRVVANSVNTEEHWIRIDGYSEWRDYAFTVIGLSLLRSRKKYRSKLDEDLFFLGNVGFGFLFTSSLTLIVPSIVQPTVHWWHYIILGVSIIGLYCINRRTSIYPYVSASFDGGQKYPKATSKWTLLWIIFSFFVGSLGYLLTYVI